MKRVWIVLVWVCIFVGGIRAQAEAPAPGEPAPGAADDARRRAAEIEEKIRALQDEHDRLLGEAELAELDEEREEEFKEMQAEARECLVDLKEELKEARKELDEEKGAWRMVTLARIKNLRGRMTACEQMLKLPDVTALPQAREIRHAMEIAETMWWMVTEPKTEGAAELENMIDTVREHGNDADLLALLQQFREMHKADVAAAEKQFNLWVARKEAGVKAEQLTEAFWRRAERLEDREGDNERDFEAPPD